MTIRRLDGTAETRHAGAPVLGASALAATRLPPGHPEGYLEAFANLYRDFARVLRGEGGCALLPGAADGLRGMHFMRLAVQSSGRGGGWVELG